MDAKVQRWVQRQGWDRAVGHYQTFWREQLRRPTTPCSPPRGSLPASA